MIIQGLGNITSAYEATYKAATERQTASAPTANYAKKVTISNAAKNLAAIEGNTVFTQQRTPAQENLLRAASSDKASAEKIAYDMANASSTIFYDIRGQRGVGDGTGDFVRKLSSTGEIVNKAYEDNFFKQASLIDTQRRSLYESEKARGTDPLSILGKMIDFTNSQSEDYLEASGWTYKGVKA
ncbi:hypothetical protein [Azonexus sp.]|uniref:hypothetical protein n=1 Tax=Azonexus sp. TaxID=1872668 RepID=UPI0027B897D7|nr:hypothetical protein [Azonexus sp.]